MEKKDIYNIGLIFVIGVFAYIIFRRMNYQEGFDSSSNVTSSSTSSTNGIAGNSSTYLSQIQSQNTKFSDSFNITNYRTQYENIIMGMDDLVNNLMLQTVLSVNQSNPQQSLIQLGELNNAKTALNNVMKFIDGK
jgi:soluble cytochrome b562